MVEIFLWKYIDKCGYNRCGEVVARLLRPMWRGYQSCGEVTQPSVARLPNLWRDYLWRGYLVARLQSGYRWQSNISLESATFQLHFGFSSSFSAILYLNCIGKHIGLCFGSWDAEPWQILKLIQRYNLTVCAVMGIYWRQYHVKNKKYGNFVCISSLTGKCTAQKLKKLLQFYSMDMFTLYMLYGHIDKPK